MDDGRRAERGVSRAGRVVSGIVHGFVAFLLSGLLSCAPSERPTRIVLISLDTLRLDGLAEETMPRTFAWARRGLRFQSHFSSSSTTQPTHASLFTGLHPWEHGVTRNGIIMGEEHVTIVERLKDAGYETYGVVGSFPMHAKFGFDQGFDRFINEFTSFDFVKEWGGKRVGKGGFNTEAPHIVRHAERLLDEARGTRQFFFLHFYDAHAPYGDSAGLPVFTTDSMILQRIIDGASNGDELIRSARTHYDQDLRALDDELGKLLDRLMADGSMDTHVVLLSDHGESFGEDGSLGHGKRLTEPQLRVPLFVLSSRARSGVREDPVGTVDIARTILGIAGIDAGDLNAVDLLDPSSSESRNVVGMRRTFEEPFREPRIDGRHHVVQGNAFFVFDGERLMTGDSTTVTLGDLGGEALTDERSEAARLLFRSFEQRLSGASAQEILDEETQSALRALGYAR